MDSLQVILPIHIAININIQLFFDITNYATMYNLGLCQANAGKSTG